MQDLGNGELKMMRDAGFAVYTIYKTRSLDRTKSTIIDRYLRGGSDMMTNQVALPFNSAPTNLVIDLKTMKVLANTVEHKDAIEICNRLK